MKKLKIRDPMGSEILPDIDAPDNMLEDLLFDEGIFRILELPTIANYRSDYQTCRFDHLLAPVVLVYFPELMKTYSIQLVRDVTTQ